MADNEPTIPWALVKSEILENAIDASLPSLGCDAFGSAVVRYLKANGVPEVRDKDPYLFGAILGRELLTWLKSTRSERLEELVARVITTPPGV